MRIALASFIIVTATVCAQQSASVWDGVYTQEQASRGKTLYTKDCASCHGAALDGSGQAPPLAGADFKGNWNGQTVDDLFEKIQTSMPADQPGKLNREQNADILGFLLGFNGFPAGQKDLPADAATLQKIRFQAAKPSRLGGRFQLEHGKDDFGVRSHGIVETLSPTRTKVYPLPQSTPTDYRRLRYEDLRINPLATNHYDRQEVIGPYQIEDGKIWIGNSYYDSEGETGVGAFGYFDTSTRRYTLFSPREIASYEIGAILVEPDTVWLALDQFVEDISKVPGGLVRWNRSTHEIQKYPLEFVVDGVRRNGEWLRLQTRDGYALFRDGKLRRFLTNGKPIAKFPPPPTHY